MTAPKLTGWYGGDQKPTRPGLYQRMYPAGVCYCYWGGFWGYGGDTKLEAFEVRSYRASQAYPWRGLASKPYP